jgi:two-component system sensor histidine kinase KdpD
MPGQGENGRSARRGPPAARGRLRTYLGIAPGVGKTYAMLRDGRAQRRRGVDAVLAFWQRHGRPATAGQVDGLEVLTGTISGSPGSG